MKLEINRERKTQKFTNMWKLGMLLNKWDKEEIKRKLENILKQLKYNIPKLVQQNHY